MSQQTLSSLEQSKPEKSKKLTPFSLCPGYGSRAQNRSKEWGACPASHDSQLRGRKDLSRGQIQAERRLQGHSGGQIRLQVDRPGEASDATGDKISWTCPN